ncbi:MAG: RNase P subunit p30 family protein, partial [Candidatus Helarchaeota archaeon]
MKIYADLHINSNFGIGADPPADMVAIASKLGFSYVCFDDFNKKSFSEIEKFKKNIQESNRTNVKVLTRLDLVGNDTKVIKQRLQNIRPHVEIIGLKCKKKAIFNWALQDTRVDLLTFFDYTNFYMLTYEAAKLANR